MTRSVALTSRHFLLAAAAAGGAAAVLSTVVQVVLWLLLTDSFPAVLWRDARLTAAIVLGARVLPPPATFDWEVMIVASAIHFGLSLAYGWVFCALTRDLAPRSGLAAGGVLGVLLYVINLYGFTFVFPWFAASRDAIALAAHVAFGLSAVGVGQLLLRASRGDGSPPTGGGAERPKDRPPRAGP